VSEPENFVSRWLRLKRESGSRRKYKTELRESAAPSGAAVTTAANEDGVVETETHATPTFDPTSLPSIHSITAGTDIRNFLQTGVPAKLTEAALRRAWVTDPAIRDFIGIAENQWDFTDPTTIPGFGPLQETNDKPSLITQAAESLDKLSARLTDTSASADKPGSATGDSRRDELENTARETRAALATRAVDREMSNAAPENGRVGEAAKNNLSLGSSSPRRRRHAHGGALPR
jgi:Protein of unknown function (DUF3306)